MSLIASEEVKSIIEEKQKELCPLGLYGRRYVYGADRDRWDALDEILDRIDSIPTIDPVKHGRWISIGEGYHWHYECSECHWKDGYPLDDRHRYCPNCGAQMDEVTVVRAQK